MNILVVNQYAGNKGDRAVLHFLLRELARHGVDSITVSTHDRRFWPDGATFGAKLVPWGWNCEGAGQQATLRYRYWWEKRRITRRVFFPLVRDRVRRRRPWGYARYFCNRGFRAALNKADLVISTGGHHVTTRFAPNAVVEMTYDLMHTCLSGKPFVLWSQTIGPLELTNSQCEESVATVLRAASRIYLRDETSARVVEQLGVDLGRVTQTYESVIGLNDEVASYVPPSSRSPVMGVAIYNAERRTADHYRQYVETIAAIADHVARDGMRVLFFPHEMKGAGVDDRKTIRDIIARMQRSDVANVLDDDLDSLEHLRRVAQCRMFLGHKTHSVVFALTAGTPLLALAYHPKTADFLRQYRLDEHCIRDGDLTIERACGVYARINEHLDETGRQQFETSRTFGATVRNDFQDMLRAFASGGTPSIMSTSSIVPTPSETMRVE